MNLKDNMKSFMCNNRLKFAFIQFFMLLVCLVVFGQKAQAQVCDAVPGEVLMDVQSGESTGGCRAIRS